LILGITGRIASGKSTLSEAVVAELERRGRTAKAIDLDIVPREVAEQLARTSSVDVVVIDGDPPLDADRYVTLTIDLDEALRRVRLDPTRRLSKDPVFLRRHYNEAHVERGLVLDTSTIGIEDAARAVADYAE
jgi:ABC-type dipeptide/oligopeptide/nickel transport system ATPase subunit